MKVLFVSRAHYNCRVKLSDGCDKNLGTLWAPRSEEAFEILRQLVRDHEEISTEGAYKLLQQLETGEVVDDDEVVEDGE